MNKDWTTLQVAKKRLATNDKKYHKHKLAIAILMQQARCDPLALEAFSKIGTDTLVFSEIFKKEEGALYEFKTAGEDKHLESKDKKSSSSKKGPPYGHEQLKTLLLLSDVGKYVCAFLNAEDDPAEGPSVYNLIFGVADNGKIEGFIAQRNQRDELVRTVSQHMKEVDPPTGFTFHCTWKKVVVSAPPEPPHLDSAFWNSRTDVPEDIREKIKEQEDTIKSWVKRTQELLGKIPSRLDDCYVLVICIVRKQPQLFSFHDQFWVRSENEVVLLKRDLLIARILQFHSRDEHQEEATTKAKKELNSD
jgi:hypothetical protein